MVSRSNRYEYMTREQQILSLLAQFKELGQPDNCKKIAESFLISLRQDK